MNATLQQLQQVEIQQILALRPNVTVEAAKQIHQTKMQLISQLKQERLVYHADSRRHWLNRIVNCLKTPQIQS